MRGRNYSEAEIVYVEHPTNGRFNDLTEDDFCRLSVLGYAGNRSWWCVCICGEIRKVCGRHLISGATTSCGCLQTEIATKSSTTHGETHTYLYSLWLGIKKRTGNPNYHGYELYGGRGITMFEAWQDSYEAFSKWISSYLGERPDGYSIDRINNDGPYAPGNLRWADRKTQRLNQRGVVLFNGECLLDVAKRTKLNYGTLKTRVSFGWCADCLTKPINSKCPHRKGANHL